MSITRSSTAMMDVQTVKGSGRVRISGFSGLPSNANYRIKSKPIKVADSQWQIIVIPRDKEGKTGIFVEKISESPAISFAKHRLVLVNKKDQPITIEGKIFEWSGSTMSFENGLRRGTHKLFDYLEMRDIIRENFGDEFYVKLELEVTTRIEQHTEDELYRIATPEQARLELGTKMYESYARGEYCDVKFKVKTSSGFEIFPAQKITLCYRSNFFAAMFRSHMQESRETDISIEGFKPNVFKTLLDYLHGGAIDLGKLTYLKGSSASACSPDGICPLDQEEEELKKPKSLERETKDPIEEVKEKEVKEKDLPLKALEAWLEKPELKRGAEEKKSELMAKEKQETEADNHIDFVFELAHAADYYQIVDLKNYCEQYLIRNLSLENLVAWLVRADQLACKRVKEACLDYYATLTSEQKAGPSFAQLAQPEYKKLADELATVALPSSAKLRSLIPVAHEDTGPRPPTPPARWSAPLHPYTWEAAAAAAGAGVPSAAAGGEGGGGPTPPWGVSIGPGGIPQRWCAATMPSAIYASNSFWPTPPPPASLPGPHASNQASSSGLAPFVPFAAPAEAGADLPPVPEPLPAAFLPVAADLFVPEPIIALAAPALALAAGDNAPPPAPASLAAAPAALDVPAIIALAAPVLALAAGDDAPLPAPASLAAAPAALDVPAPIALVPSAPSASLSPLSAVASAISFASTSSRPYIADSIHPATLKRKHDLIETGETKETKDPIESKEPIASKEPTQEIKADLVKRIKVNELRKKDPPAGSVSAALFYYRQNGFLTGDVTTSASQPTKLSKKSVLKKTSA